MANPTEAAAYQINSAATDDCHERITLKALEQVRDEYGLEADIPANRDERTLVRDAPFPLRYGMDDLGAFTLALANRNVDLKGNQPDDLDQLTTLHGNPSHQSEHCLRRPGDDGDDGAQQAVDACRDVIMDRVRASIETLGEDGNVDPNDRHKIEVFVEFQGPIEVELPSFYVEMGQALHTLQDAFTHHLRGDSHDQVHTVLNYSEYAQGTLDEAEDGPPHSSKLDECTNLDSLRSERMDTAILASTELLAAVLWTDGDSEAREQAAEVVLDEYMFVKEDCTKSNGWCDAADASYPPDPQGGCSVGPRPGDSRWSLMATLILAAAALALGRHRTRPRSVKLRAVPNSEAHQLRTWRRRPISRNHLRVLLLPLALGVSSMAAPARAQEPLEPPSSSTNDGREFFPWGVYAAGSIAVQNPAAAVTLGGRYRVGENFLLGLGGEYNPIYSKTLKEFRPGMTNVFASFIFRIPTAEESLALRSSYHLGASILNFDIYGAPAGSTGLYGAFNLLGLDYHIARQFYIVVDPAHIAIAAPQLRGAPFVYSQYRFTLGIQWGA